MISLIDNKIIKDAVKKSDSDTDANKKRKVEVFEDIYNKLLREYISVLSDSRILDVLKNK